MIKISQKQQNILKIILEIGTMQSSAVHEEILKRGDDLSLVSVKRALSEMAGLGLLIVSGSGRSTNYSTSNTARAFLDMDAKKYIEVEPDKRFGSNGYNFGYFSEFPTDIFDDIPPVAIRKRVKDYLEYYDSDEWQDNTDKPFPEIIFICPNKRIKGHLYYFILKKRWDGTEPEFYLAIREIVKVKGLNSKVLEKVEERE